MASKKNLSRPGAAAREDEPLMGLRRRIDAKSHDILISLKEWIELNLKHSDLFTTNKALLAFSLEQYVEHFGAEDARRYVDIELRQIIKSRKQSMH